MDILELQRRLKNSGRYAGVLDGDYGPQSGAAVMLAMTDGPDTALTEAHYKASAARLGCPVENIKAFAAVESSGAGFAQGRPTILFEGHRFHKATGGQFSSKHPDVSYPVWDRTRYPASQGGRYAQLIKAVGLNVDAGFASASYGKFQVLGENYKLCGYNSPFEFAEAQAYDEETQLRSFESFIVKRGLCGPLSRGEWDTVARIYNGSAYAKNKYDIRLADAARRFRS